MHTNDVWLNLYQSNWVATFSYFVSLFLQKKPSTWLDSVETNLDGISSLIYKIIPLLLSFRSRRKGALKPFIINWLVGKLSWSFVSEIIKTSILSLIREIRNSNLFLRTCLFEKNHPTPVRCFTWVRFRQNGVFHFVETNRLYENALIPPRWDLTSTQVRSPLGGIIFSM